MDIDIINNFLGLLCIEIVAFYKWLITRNISICNGGKLGKTQILFHEEQLYSFDGVTPFPSPVLPYCGYIENGIYSLVTAVSSHL